jgi:hypothetical protein
MLTADVGLAGDTSGDGQINFADLAPFVMALTDPSGYDAEFPALDRQRRSDINGDGACNFADLGPFVNLFTGGQASGNATSGSRVNSATQILDEAFAGL